MYTYAECLTLLYCMCMCLSNPALLVCGQEDVWESNTPRAHAGSENPNLHSVGVIFQYLSLFMK